MWNHAINFKYMQNCGFFCYYVWTQKYRGKSKQTFSVELLVTPEFYLKYDHLIPHWISWITGIAMFWKILCEWTKIPERVSPWKHSKNCNAPYCIIVTNTGASHRWSKTFAGGLKFSLRIKPVKPLPYNYQQTLRLAVCRACNSGEMHNSTYNIKIL